MYTYIYIYVYIYIYICRTRRARPRRRQGCVSLAPPDISKRACFFVQNVHGFLASTRYCFTSRLMCTNQSWFIPPPTRIAHTVALLLHDHCAIYDPLPRPPFCMPCTIQHGPWQYRVKAKRVQGSPEWRCVVLFAVRV